MDRITALLDWPALEGVLVEVYTAPMGWPSFPVGLLPRALLLQALHGLSDPAAEAALADRLSFRRFLRVGLDEPTPDPSTLWRFREALARRQLDQALFAALSPAQIRTAPNNRIVRRVSVNLRSRHQIQAIVTEVYTGGVSRGTQVRKRPA